MSDDANEQEVLDLSAMTLEELCTLQEQVLAEKQRNAEQIASCRGQIDAAKARALEGNYSDPKWFAAVNSAARHAGRRDQQMAADLREIRLAIREANMRQAAADKAAALAGRAGDDDAIGLLIKAIRLIEAALDLMRG